MFPFFLLKHSVLHRPLSPNWYFLFCVTTQTPSEGGREPEVVTQIELFLLNGADSEVPFFLLWDYLFMYFLCWMSYGHPLILIPGTYCGFFCNSVSWQNRCACLHLQRGCGLPVTKPCCAQILTLSWANALVTVFIPAVKLLWHFLLVLANGQISNNSSAVFATPKGMLNYKYLITIQILAINKISGLK